MFKNVTGLIIENKSSFPLEYVNSGYSAGYPIEPVLSMLTEQSGRCVIPPNTTAALVWCLHMGGNFGELNTHCRAQASYYALIWVPVPSGCRQGFYTALRISGRMGPVVKIQ